MSVNDYITPAAHERKALPLSCDIQTNRLVRSAVSLLLQSELFSKCVQKTLRHHTSAIPKSTRLGLDTFHFSVDGVLAGSHSLQSHGCF